MSGPVFIASARRSAVLPRRGAFRSLEVDALAAPVMAACLADAGIEGDEVDEVIAGNALYGGGNPARRAALLAGLPDSVPAITVDRQCCAGLDAILYGARLIESGAADCVLAGGVESFSRAPIRATRPLEPDQEPEAYDRPPFTPWPARDPDMAVAAASLAQAMNISTDRQVDWTVESHRKAFEALSSDRAREIVTIEHMGWDGYTRKLRPAACLRSRKLAGAEPTGILAATTAVEADASAFVALMSPRLAARKGIAQAMRLTDGCSRGALPELPGLAPIAATSRLFRKAGLSERDLAVAEVMEAFAAQAIACVDALRLPETIVNRGGGALARGHPIGASGAILAVRLFHELAKERPGAFGLATIAAAGGLATSVLMQRA
ncbi:thiolase family protein [Stappia sp. F7233]|uniref:Thiolase family protein n=1 Tax=Stappia albiluteola TaxID=2758565 RepID=A0A839AEP5_9HYPH|nr:thiolase family protein [Stappia albiluteola]MBA5777424.1 thiolase family protein [Stappia albiluteola]